ncbi:uncharacterized protein OCT59_016463 [Rhizophagus irregularis]|nr:hypothetical protein OCT59_016463 [Rhizophagus irregularis]
MKTKFINPLLRKISIILRYHDDLLTSASGESKIMMKRICIEEINHQFLPKVSWLLSSKRVSISDYTLEIGCRFEDSQIYREISTLHALGDLSCVPTILFEGYTMSGSMVLLTDLPLESWISDNDNIDDYIIFQIILDLLLCLEKNMPVVTRMEMWPYETLYKEMVIFILLTLALQLCCNFSLIHVKHYSGLHRFGRIIGVINR